MNTFCYCWVKPFVKNFAKPFQEVSLPRNCSPQLLQKRIHEFKKGLFSHLVRVFWPKTLPYALGYCLTAASYLCICVLIGKFVKWLEEGDSLYEGLVMAGTVSFLSLLAVVMHHRYFYRMHVMGGVVRSALMGEIFEKVLKMTKETIERIGSGHVLSIVSSDLHMCDLLFLFASFVWISPIYALANGCLLYLTIGWSGLLGLLVLVLFVPLQALFGKLFIKFHKECSKYTDSKMKKLTELIEHIYPLKAHCLETTYLNSIKELRHQELKETRKSGALRSSNMIIFFSAQGLVSLVVFGTYLGLGNQLETEVVFTTLALLTNAQYFLSVALPFGIEFLSEFYVACRRIESLLREKEVQRTPEPEVADLEVREFSLGNQEEGVCRTYRTDIDTTNLQDNFCRSDKRTFSAFTEKEVSEEFTWKLSNQVLAKQVDFPKNKLSCIVGPVGCGKSTLLYSMLNEEGFAQVCISGSVALSEQKPCIISGTFKDNILFGREFSHKKYQRVIKAACLQPDLKSMGSYDQTLIDESTLSGGQKARVGIARALYSESDVYVFDDPFSALDPQVTNSIFQNCILGLLKDKTRIVVTHNLAVLPQADNIIVLGRKGCKFQGSFFEMQQKPSYKKLLTGYQFQAPTTETHDSFEATAKDSQETESSSKAKLSSLWELFKRGLLGRFTLVAVAVLYLGGQFLYMSVSLWVAGSSHNLEDLVWIVCGLVVVSVLRSHFFYQSILQATKQLHDLMLLKLTQSPIWFFDKTSAGSITNCFGYHIKMLDNFLPFVLVDFLQIFFVLLGIFVTSVYINPVLVVPLGVLVTVAVCMYHKSLPAIKHFRDLEHKSFESLHSLILSSLSGVVTIRALDSTKFFSAKFSELAETACKHYYLYVSAYRYLQFNLDLCGVGFSVATIFSSVALKGYLDPGLIGASLVFCLQVISYIVWTFRQWGEVQNNMLSLQRVIAFKSLPEETQSHKASIQVETGSIEFCKVDMCYEEGTNVLNKVNLKIEPGSKVGIIGRSGCGKSSMLRALLGLNSLSHGKVYVDNVDISSVSLSSLRKNFGVITQNPFIFKGTLRENLDLYKCSSEEAIWQALSEVSLQKRILKRKCGLDSQIDDLKLSAGEKQILCLARTFLLRHKVVILDEATSNIDLPSEETILGILKDKLRSCTVVSVAHRMNTLVDFDLVVILDQGSIVTAEHPSCLLQTDNLFSQGISQTTA